MQKLENWKHSSGPVNYSVLWRLPGSKKTYNFQKTRRVFSSFLGRKSNKIRSKNHKKRSARQKLMKAWSLGPLLGPRVDFGWILGPRRGPQNNPTLDPEIDNSDLIGAGGPLGAPRTILVDFWFILESFRVPRWSSWDLPGTLLGPTSSKQQQR